MGEEKKTPRQILDEAVATGGIVAVMYFDISSNNKDAVQGLLTELVKKISGEPGVVSCVGEIEEPLELEEKFWTSSAEVTMLTKNFSYAAAVAIRYGPIGVEVLRPNEIKMPINEAQSLLLNISQVGQEFTNFILQKNLMNEEEREKFQKKLAARAEMGRKLLEKKEEKKQG